MRVLSTPTAWGFLPNFILIRPFCQCYNFSHSETNSYCVLMQIICVIESKLVMTVWGSIFLELDKNQIRHDIPVGATIIA